MPERAKPANPPATGPTLPRLPPELLSHIVALTQEHQPPLARQQTRNAFRSVCREWGSALDYWVEVCADSPEQIEGLASRLSAPRPTGEPPHGQTVRSVYVGLFDRFGVQTGSRVATRLVRLFGSVPQVRKVELSVGRQGITREGLLGSAVCQALSRLGHITHFSLTRPAEGELASQPLAAYRLRLLLQSWPELESLVVEVKSSGDRESHQNLFTNQTHLTHLGFNGIDFLRNVPLTVRSVRVIDYHVFEPDHNWPTVALGTPGQLRSRLSALASTLKELTLQGTLDPRAPAGLRGYHARLAGGLRDVCRLSIPAFAVADLATALAPLAHLEELEVSARPDDARCAEAVGSDEVVRLVLDAPALTRLTVTELAVARWTDEGRRAVREAAEQEGVELVDEGGWNGQ